MFKSGDAVVFQPSEVAVQSILIKNGRVIDPASQTDSVADCAIADGRVVAIGDIPADFTPDRVIDATGRWVTPGLIDIHVHLREPGREDKETIITGCSAAVAGGFTAVASMPNTTPVADSVDTIVYINSKASDAPCRVYPVGAMTTGLGGNEVCPFEEMKSVGMRAVSDDGRSVYRSNILKNAMTYAGSAGIPILAHCEDEDLAKGAMNESSESTRLGVAGVPSIAEDIDVVRHILIAEYTKTPLHICHVSTSGALDQIRFAKSKGLKITAETAPHYWFYTDEDVLYNTHRKMNPPLRGVADREAIIKALQDGTIDVIASDHAPHTVEDKDGEFDRASFGVVGLETMVAASITALVDKGYLTPLQLIEKLSYNPAKVLGVPGGSLAVGQVADVTIIDPTYEWTVDPSEFFTKGRNSAFSGEVLRGVAVTTIVDGRIVFEKSINKA